MQGERGRVEEKLPRTPSEALSCPDAKLPIPILSHPQKETKAEKGRRRKRR